MIHVEGYSTTQHCELCVRLTGLRVFDSCCPRGDVPEVEISMKIKVSLIASINVSSATFMSLERHIDV